MKQYLLPNCGSFYKANLHCHSTCSDGNYTPQELKDIYKSAGYSVLAFTDHNVLVDHSELDDEDFINFTGTEIDVNWEDNGGNARKPCYHINFYPEDQHNTALPCYNPRYVWGNHVAELRDAQKYVGEKNYVRSYSTVNEMIAEFTANGFLATVNHPTWSLQGLDDYRSLDGLFAMEIYNHSCYLVGYEEVNGHVLDELWRMGKRLFCVAADDNHNSHPHGSARGDSLGGFVMIKAEELSHKAIFQALKRGDFYASNGPLIEELYVEGNILTVKTSPVARISLTTAVRQTRTAYPEERDGEITEAQFDLSRLFPGSYRITVTDKRGKQAWTQPVFGEFSGRIQ